MTKEIKKQPELRFPEFTGDWEQRKLGDISEIKTGPFGSMLHADDYVSDGVPIITTEHFKTGTLPADKCGLPQVSENDFNRLSAYILNEGDIVFSRVGSVDINALITPFQNNWLFSGRVLRVRPQGKNSPQFLHTLLETDNIKSDIRARAVGQAMPSINTEILKITQLLLPVSMSEQELLGEYFRNLDNLIALHQRELDELKELKKCMLQKMFPKNGEKVPEIRFPEFTGNWEQRKFNELYKKVNHKNDMTYGISHIISVANMYYKKDAVVKNEEYLKTYNIFELGDIAFEGNKSKNFAHGRFVENTIGNGIVSHVFDVFKPISNYDLMFWKYLINNEAVMGKVMARCTKSSTMMTNLVAKDFLNESILVPTIEEQQKIGTYFSNLDNLITLHQKELDGYKELKKGLLQQMFC